MESAVSFPEKKSGQCFGDRQQDLPTPAMYTIEQSTSLSGIVMSVLASAAAHCWAKTKDYAWVDTRGAGHVQMGYSSAVDESNFPDVVPILPSPARGAQLVNLITPAEFEATNKKTPTFIDSTEESAISVVAWRRVPCGGKEANLHINN
eukprot:gene25149-30370_t